MYLVHFYNESSFLGDVLIACAFQRPAEEQKELLNKWNEMGTDEPGKGLFYICLLCILCLKWP